MPTRTQYLMDPEYVRQCQTAFGAAPEKPYLELFIPERFRTRELLDAVYGPIWRLEFDVICRATSVSSAVMPMPMRPSTYRGCTDRARAAVSTTNSIGRKSLVAYARVGAPRAR